MDGLEMEFNMKLRTVTADGDNLPFKGTEKSVKHNHIHEHD